MHPSADADETFQTLTSRHLVLPQKQCWQKQENNVQQKQKFWLYFYSMSLLVYFILLICELFFVYIFVSRINEWMLV